MKTPSLVLFAALMLIGWTSLAGSAIAALAGQQDFSSRAHPHHEEAPAEVVNEPAPLLSNR